VLGSRGRVTDATEEQGSRVSVYCLKSSRIAVHILESVCRVRFNQGLII
jgi:hypothetical protein